MAWPIHLASVLPVAIAFVIVVELLRRGRLRERHAIWWIIAGACGLIVTIFPNILDWMASSLGIAVPMNLAFFAGIVVLFLVSVQQSSELTKLEDRVRTLAEQDALLRERLTLLEREIKNNPGEERSK